MMKINATDLREILRATPASHNIMLSGRHGIGKSQILEKFFRAEGFPVFALFLGQMSDPGDLIGLPRLDEKSGKTIFAPPYWFPMNGKPVVLFLDELNRARPEILQAVMDLTLNRALAGRKLPEGSRIISAVNSGEEYQLTDLDPALVSRFNIYEFCPTVQEWLLWATENGIDSRVVDFISANPQMLDGAEFFREDLGLEKTPDRRAWERVSAILPNIQDVSLLKTVVAGIIGMPAAAKFLVHLSKQSLLSAKEILLGSLNKVVKVLQGYSVPDLASVNESLLRFIETEGYGKSDTAKVAENLNGYFDFLLTENRREAIAHFANLFSSSSYSKVKFFVIMNCTNLYAKMEQFVKSIGEKT